jgi:glycopeptide antibiotics resistance protein
MPIGHTINGFSMIFVIPIYLIIAGLLAFLKRKNGKNINVFRETFKFLFAIVIVLIIGLNLFPINIPNGSTGFPTQIKIDNNYIPFATVTSIKSLTSYLSVSLILFLLLGVCVPVLWQRFRSMRNFVILVFLVSISLEILKVIEHSLNLTYGSFDINNIILNVCVMLIGYYIYHLVNKYNIGFIKRLKLSNV